MAMELKPVRGARAGDAGFSLIEVLVAALILVLVVLALVPLFAQSMNNTLAGREYSVASQFGRSRADELYQLPLESEEMLVAPGDRESVSSELWDPDADAWTATAPASPSPWRRTTTVRQYNVNDLLQEGRLVHELDGGAPAPQVHLREVIVEVESEREGGAAGRGRSITLTTVRGF